MMRLHWIKIALISYSLVACGLGGGGGGADSLNGGIVSRATGTTDSGDAAAVGDGQGGGQPAHPSIPGGSGFTVRVHVNAPPEVFHPGTTGISNNATASNGTARSGGPQNGIMGGFADEIYIDPGSFSSGPVPQVSAWKIGAGFLESSETNSYGDADMFVRYVSNRGTPCSDVFQIRACYSDGVNQYISQLETLHCSQFDGVNTPNLTFHLELSNQPIACPLGGNSTEAVDADHGIKATE